MGRAADDVLKELTEIQAPKLDVKVMVVDDEPVIIRLVRAILEDLDYTFITFDAGEAALEAIPTEKPQVAIIDKNLGGMSGIDLVREGKAMSPDTEFLIITGYASVESAVEAMSLGAFGYITKPFHTPEVVRDNVRAAVARNEAVRQNRLLVERLKSAFEELYRTKVELDMLADVVREKLRVREQEIHEVLSSVLRPLAAAGTDVGIIAEHFDKHQNATHDGRVLLGRARMIEGLVNAARERVEELTNSLDSEAAES